MQIRLKIFATFVNRPYLIQLRVDLFFDPDPTLGHPCFRLLFLYVFLAGLIFALIYCVFKTGLQIKIAKLIRQENSKKSKKNRAVILANLKHKKPSKITYDDTYTSENGVSNICIDPA